MRNEEKYDDIPDKGSELINSILENIEQCSNTRNRAKQFNQELENKYKNVIEIINYLNNQLDDDKFKDEITTDFNLKSTLFELRIKLCKLHGL